MGVFVKLVSPDNSSSFYTLNVVSFQEEPLRWQGNGNIRAFDNTLLSTLRDPRREWTLTVEFDTVQGLEAFVNFCATAIDFQTGRPHGLRPLYFRSDPSPTGALANGGPITVRVELGARRSRDYVEAGVIKQSWQIDLVMREG